MQTDTIQQIDTVTHISQQVRYVGETFPSYPQTEMWVFICLGALFLLLAVAVLFSSSPLVNTLKVLLNVTDRDNIFNDTALNSPSVRFLFAVLFTGVFSLFAYLYLQPEIKEFSLTGYGMFFLVTALLFCAKLLLSNVLGFVFLNHSNLKIAKKTYIDILSLLGIILYPLLVIRIYASSFFDYKILDYIVLFLLLSTSLFIIYKLIRIFFSKLVDLFYILLYLCTLEILPFIALFQIYEIMV